MTISGTNCGSNESNRRNVAEAFAGYSLDGVSPKTVGAAFDSTVSNMAVFAFGGIQAQNTSYATDLTAATERAGQ